MTSGPQNGLVRVVDSPVFAAAVLAVIVANAIVLGLQTAADDVHGKPHE